MRRIICLFLMLILIAAELPMSALAELGSGLQVDLQSLCLAEEWQGESSDTHVYLILPATLTNWETDTLCLSENVALTLIYADKYEFSGELSFDSDEIEPLVELEGSIVVRVPSMVTEHPEDIALVLTVGREEFALEADFSPLDRSKSNCFEGEGFDTPEEAVLAYINAMQANDVDGIISTFAIETMVENIDVYTVVSRLLSANLSTWPTVPADNTYAKQLLVSKAYGDIVNNLYYQYVVYTASGTEYAEGFLSGSPIRFGSNNREEQIDDYISAMNSDRFSTALQTCSFVEWLNPADLYEYYESESCQKSISKYTQQYGADELALLCARLNINGKDWLLTMDCARYGNTWYNLKSNGYMAAFLGLSSYLGGLVPMDEL